PDHKNPRVLYERDHEHARSWNPGVYELENTEEATEYGHVQVIRKPTTLGPYYQRDYCAPTASSQQIPKVSPSVPRISPTVPSTTPSIALQSHYSIPVVINEPPQPTQPSIPMDRRGSNTLGV
ncbi:hypothetical protein PFISCL1PPCAC_3993, partial [Pristionchus fissidentatus]